MYLRIATLLVALSGLLLAADVTGKWSFAVETSAGSGSPTFELVQKGTVLTGTYEGVVGKAPLKGTVEGNKIEFVVSAGQGELKYSGTIESATQMSGKAEYPEIGDATWKASKDK
ncbi:MAG: hypothetical protein NTV52_23035 [Acidobacteria bacterium]|nr:hypothetical protein [Acidobacteriota bacterium]